MSDRAEVVNLWKITDDQSYAFPKYWLIEIAIRTAISSRLSKARFYYFMWAE